MLRASSFAARPFRWNRARQSPNGQLGGACTYPKRPKHRSPCLKLLSCAGWAVPRFNNRGEQTMTCYSALTAPLLNVVLLQAGVHRSCQRYRRCLCRILAWDACVAFLHGMGVAARRLLSLFPPALRQTNAPRPCRRRSWSRKRSTTSRAQSLRRRFARIRRASGKKTPRPTP